MKDSLCLGGAGNVAQNLSSLGAQTVLTGVVGDDPEGRWIRDNAPESRGVFIDKSRADDRQNTDYRPPPAGRPRGPRTEGDLSAGIEKKILAVIGTKPIWPARLRLQQRHCQPLLMVQALALAKKRRIPVFVDPKVPHFRLFSPVTLITPNHFEAEKIVGHGCQTDPEVERAGSEILSLVSSRYLIIKRGEQGMAVFERGKRPLHIPTVAREVFDVTGAGDTVIAAAALSSSPGPTIGEAAWVANAAAGIVVGKIGTAAVTPEELRAALLKG